jgi:hypothetical protein
VLGLLQRFPGYTFSSLMEEDSELIRLVAIHAMGTKQEGEDDG